MIEPQSKELSISVQCKLMGKSRNWYYYEERIDSHREHRDNLEKVRIKKIWKKHIFFGYRQIYHQLDDKGLHKYFNFYNSERPHQSLNGKSPDRIYFEESTLKVA